MPTVNKFVVLMSLILSTAVSFRGNSALAGAETLQPDAGISLAATDEYPTTDEYPIEYTQDQLLEIEETLIKDIRKDIKIELYEQKKKEIKGKDKKTEGTMIEISWKQTKTITGAACRWKKNVSGTLQCKTALTVKTVKPAVTETAPAAVKNDAEHAAVKPAVTLTPAELNAVTAVTPVKPAVTLTPAELNAVTAVTPAELNAVTETDAAVQPAAVPGTAQSTDEYQNHYSYDDIANIIKPIVDKQDKHFTKITKIILYPTKDGEKKKKIGKIVGTFENGFITFDDGKIKNVDKKKKSEGVQDDNNDGNVRTIFAINDEDETGKGTSFDVVFGGVEKGGRRKKRIFSFLSSKKTKERRIWDGIWKTIYGTIVEIEFEHTTSVTHDTIKLVQQCRWYFNALSCKEPIDINKIKYIPGIGDKIKTAAADVKKAAETVKTAGSKKIRSVGKGIRNVLGIRTKKNTAAANTADNTAQ